MESRIAEAVNLKHHPVALSWRDEMPPGALQFKEGRWGCVMWLAAHAAKGKPAGCGAKTFGCVGGGVGLGFGNQYVNFPGGLAGFCHFLSSGNASREGGKDLAESIEPFVTAETMDNFLQGERYLKSPDLVECFIDNLPIIEKDKPFAVFTPLKDVTEGAQEPEVIIFFVNPDQFSALLVLANYGRIGNENVIIPFAAGCQTIGIYPLREGRSDKPRAVAGLTDLSARVHIRRQLGDPDMMTFAMPLSLFLEMEENVAGSFLERPTWKSLL